MNIYKTILVSFSTLFLFNNCSRVPVTNRRQVSLLPEKTMVNMALTQYRSFLTQNPAVTANDANAQMVKKVGGKITAAVQAYLKKTKKLKH